MRRICLLIVCLLNAAAWGQTSEDTLLEPDALQYYLVQAFQATSSLQRKSLNHIGIQVQEQAGDYLVTAVLESYPAHLAGINRGDWIRSVDGDAYHPVFSFNHEEDIDSGFRQEEIEKEIIFERGGNLISANITATYENLYDSYRTATGNSIQQFNAGNKTIGYLRLWGLSRNTNDLISYANILQEFANCDGLILDLRNAYGYLDASHLNLLLSENSAQTNYSGKLNQHSSIDFNHSRSNDNYYRRPIAILLNSETRAGAELLAQQLAKQDRMVTLGETTAGEIGIYYSSNESSALRYQPATETLVDGKLFEQKGLTPKQEISYPFEQNSRSDPQYQFAVNILLGII